MDWKLFVTLLTNLINQSLSSPTGCSCFNPLIGKPQEYYGRPEYACETNDWCFVRCDGSCSDKQFASGIFDGKCKSRSACFEGSSPATKEASESFKCGLHVTGLEWIVGGTETEKNEYPWQVGFVEKGDSLIWCGGSLISDSWVLTAAHCTEPQEARNLQVLLGHHNSSDTSRTIRTNVVQIVNHPKYDQGTHNNYDLSLVKLETKIDFTRTPNVRPVCLPKDDHNDFVGYKATVSGWDTKEAGGAKSNVLLEVDVDVIDSDSCWKDFGYREAEITEQMLCAHVQGGGKDSCQGDSGGPLVTSGSGNGYTAGENFELIGVVSWGNGCAEANYPGVYARVSKQLTWIEQVTAQEGVDGGDDEPTGNEDPECPAKWKSFQESCYYFGSSPSYLSWAGSASACKDIHENSTLPSVHSLEQDQYLQANTASLPFWLGASRNIGTDYLLPSSWTWSDGTAINYTAWAIGQPNNHWLGERCVRRVQGKGKRTWDDHKCFSKTTLAVVCKLKL